MAEETKLAGSAADAPIWMKLVRDEDGIKWGNILVMLAVTVASGYLATRAQRAGSSADAGRELKMNLARKTVTIGSRLERLGRDIQERGWAVYEQAR